LGGLKTPIIDISHVFSPHKIHHYSWYDRLELRNTEIILLSVESKRERTKKLNCLSIQEKENSRLIYEREGRKTPCRLPKPEPEAEYQCRGMGETRPVGESEADGGRNPPASFPSQPVPKTKEAAGPNS